MMTFPFVIPCALRRASPCWWERSGPGRHGLLVVVLLSLALTIRAEGLLFAMSVSLFASHFALEAKTAWDFCRPGSVEAGSFAARAI